MNVLLLQIGLGLFGFAACLAFGYLIWSIAHVNFRKPNQRNRFYRAGTVGVLCASLMLMPFLGGCSTAWTTTLDNILVAAAPALINVLNIIAIAKGVPVNTALESKITTDAATIKVLAGDFAAASSSAAPTACSQLQAAISVYSNDESQVMSLASISDPATQTKVEALSALVAGTVTGILAVIPNCQQAVQMKASLERSTVPLPLKTFVDSYNATLTVKTGNPAVDAYTAKHKVHVHGKFLRVLAFGTSF